MHHLHNYTLQLSVLCNKNSSATQRTLREKSLSFTAPFARKPPLRLSDLCEKNPFATQRSLREKTPLRPCDLCAKNSSASQRPLQENSASLRSLLAGNPFATPAIFARKILCVPAIFAKNSSASQRPLREKSLCVPAIFA